MIKNENSNNNKKKTVVSLDLTKNIARLRSAPERSYFKKVVVVGGGDQLQFPEMLEPVSARPDSAVWN